MKICCQFNVTAEGGWVRFGKIGFRWKDTEVYPVSFSERNGYVKTLRIGKWLIGRVCNVQA